MNNSEKQPDKLHEGYEDPDNVKAFLFDSNMKLKVLNQLLLPKTIKYVDVQDSNKGYEVIKNMLVRGAPCIAAVGCLSIIAELNRADSFRNYTLVDIDKWLRSTSDRLIESRPTAVNLRKALHRLVEFAEHSLGECHDTEELIKRMSDFCLDAINNGLTLNKQLGEHGADELVEKVFARKEETNNSLAVLTHCNTGALATVGYGTALGVIRSLFSRGQLRHAYCTETRPYNQGSRLTAWELVREKIPATLIADNMVAYLMATRRIHAVIVGADCVAANGDTANKIGTLQIAVTANHYKVPFYVAAPTQTIDLSTKDQRSMKIEQRPASELRKIGDIALAPEEIEVWNPCFDVTPAELVTAIITEHGICSTHGIQDFMSRVKQLKEESGPIGLF